MSYATTQGKFHIALDGVGLILQGAPNNPAYKMSNAPVYGTRFASGDRDYNDLSQWWYMIQTDWSGGAKETFPFLDDAKFYYSSNIDARTKPGTVRLERQLEFYGSNTPMDREMTDFLVADIGSTSIFAQQCFIDSQGIRPYPGYTSLYSSGNCFSLRKVFAHRGYMWWLRSAGGATSAGYSNATSFPDGTAVTVTLNTVIGATVDKCDSYCAVGDTLYLFGTTTSGKIFIVKTTTAAPTADAHWTLVASFAQHNNLGADVNGSVQIGGEIVFIVEGSPLWTLFSLNIASGVVTKITEFENANQDGIYDCGKRYIQKFGANKLIITVLQGDGEGSGTIWTYDGTTLEMVFNTDEVKKGLSTKEPDIWLKGGCTIYGGYAFWGNLVYDGEHFFNFIKEYGDSVTYPAIPIGSDGYYMYMVDYQQVAGRRQSQVYRYNGAGTVYKNGANHSAFLIMSQHDKLQSIDKLLNSVTIGFERFLTGQSIAIYYSTEPTPDPNITTGAWTLLGTASYALDGGTVTSKVLQFPVNTTAKKMWFRVELVSATAETPALTDLTLEYLPMPDYKKQWFLNLNCGDEVKTLDGSLVETTGRELKSRLEKMWWTKSALDYQDVDYATTLVDDAAFDATKTTITVDSTIHFPEQGRFRVDDEEILYTSKTPTTFVGCTRGARGTRAVAHSDNAVLNNAYRVLVMAVEEQAPILAKDKHLEYIVGLTLREV